MIKEKYQKIIFKEWFRVSLSEQLGIKEMRLIDYISKDFETAKKYKKEVDEFIEKWIEFENKVKQIKVKYFNV